MNCSTQISDKAKKLRSANHPLEKTAEDRNDEYAGTLATVGVTIDAIFMVVIVVMLPVKCVDKGKFSRINNGIGIQTFLRILRKVQNVGI